MISAMEIAIFFRLLLAHILGDFFLQRSAWVESKRSGLRSRFLYYHAIIIGALTYLFLGDWSCWQLPLFIVLTHFLIDWWKSTRTDTALYFILDQGLHIAMLIIGWCWYIGINLHQVSLFFSSVSSTSLWIILCSYLLIIRPLGFLIEKLTQNWREELSMLPSTLNGLINAGTFIGYMERFIILTFILIGQYSAIGFLIAAKSIFRFSGKVENEQGRKETEYILLGTLMSFLFAIIVGIGARYFLGF